MEESSLSYGLTPSFYVMFDVFASSIQMEILRKLAALKRIFWEKSLWWTSALIKLQPLSTEPSILSKNEAHARPSCRSAENSNIFTGKPCLLSLRKTLWPIFIDGPQQFTTQSPRVSGSHLINLGRMKCWLDLRAILWFLPGTLDRKSSNLKL